MSRARSVFACQACGFESSKWLGRCPDCGEWNTLVEERRESSSEAKSKQNRLPLGSGAKPRPYDTTTLSP